MLKCYAVTGSVSQLGGTNDNSIAFRLAFVWKTCVMTFPDSLTQVPSGPFLFQI